MVPGSKLRAWRPTRTHHFHFVPYQEDHGLCGSRTDSRLLRPEFGRACEPVPFVAIAVDVEFIDADELRIQIDETWFDT